MNERVCKVAQLNGIIIIKIKISVTDVCSSHLSGGAVGEALCTAL